MTPSPDAPTDPGRRRHHVVVLGIPPVVGYDLAIAPMLFGEATDEQGRPLYRVTVASLDGAPLETTHGYAITPTADRSVVAEADTLIVPGTRVSAPRHEGESTREIQEALALVRPGTRVMSICTGAFVLAAAGLLDGRRATTHWAHVRRFRRLFPQVDVDPDVLFVDDGDVLSSAGLAAGVDLCLHVIRADHGSAVANRVARYCVVPPWRDGGQAQFIDRPVPQEPAGATAAARAWALEHLAEPVDVTAMARAAHMSLRTFTRRFSAETGRSPGAWLLDQRLRHARHLLETTDLPVDRVAEEAGLGTAASLRHHLRGTLGVSPLAYRRTFRGDAATASAPRPEEPYRLVV